MHRTTWKQHLCAICQNWRFAVTAVSLVLTPLWAFSVWPHWAFFSYFGWDNVIYFLSSANRTGVLKFHSPKTFLCQTSNSCIEIIATSATFFECNCCYTTHHQILSCCQWKFELNASAPQLFIVRPSLKSQQIYLQKFTPFCHCISSCRISLRSYLFFLYSLIVYSNPINCCVSCSWLWWTCAYIVTTSRKLHTLTHFIFSDIFYI